MKLKKFLLTGLSFGLVAALAIGGTIAYLTSKDSDVNVMTLGNVKIEQHEYEWNDKGTELVEFTQAKPLLPYVGTIAWKNTEYADGAYRQFNVENAVDKYVTVENTGKTDAYVRTIIAFEKGDLTTDEFDQYIGIALNAQNGATYKYDGSWLWEGLDYSIEIEVDGNDYIVYVGTHQAALKPEEETVPSLLQMYMDKTAENKHVDAVDGNDNGLYDILVVSQAVQADGFSDATTALDAAFGDITTNNHPWVDAKSSTVDSDDAFKKALQNTDASTIIVNLTDDVTYDIAEGFTNVMGGEKTDTIVINGNGHTITFNKTNNDTNRINTNGAKLVINDAVITNSGMGRNTWNSHDIVFACDVELNNVTSEKAIALMADATLNYVTIADANDSDTYAIWIQANGQTVNINGSTIDMRNATDGRGIKIDEQYVSNPAKVTLNVKNTTFKTEEKSAILVKSVAGADINVSNIDILSVSADPINAVWVDADATASYDLVTVTGGTKVVENSADVPSVKTVADDEDLAEALADSSVDVIYLESGNYSVVDVRVNRKLFVAAANGATVKLAGVNGQTNNNECDVTFTGITIDNSLQSEGWYTGTSSNMKVCVGVWGGNYTFENCTFNVTGESKAETGVMSWWTTNHGVMNFTNCTFNGENDNARAMQIYGNYDLNVTGCTFNTAKDYSLKFVGAEDCVANFKNNIVNATTNFVQTGSATYAGENYKLVFENNTLGDGINHVYVENAEGQTIIINGETKAATDEAIY